MVGRRPLLRPGLLAGVSLLAVLGCSLGIGVRPVGEPTLLQSWRASAVEAGDLSPRSWQTLHQLDFDQLYRRHPTQALARLHERALRHPRPDFLFALAEMSYLLGRHSEKAENNQACVYYYLCAGYAYHYLFPAAAVPEELRSSTFDPRFRVACDLYNTGLSKCIRAAQRAGQLDPRQELRLPTPDGQGFTLAVAHEGFAWKPEEFGPLRFVEDFQVVGLANHYHTYGLGVPLIAVRAAPKGAPHGSAAFYPDDVSFPVTAFFRFEGSLADLRSQRAGRLELVNPLEIQALPAGTGTIPLETDLTTPLAYFLSHNDLGNAGLAGFLRADKLEAKSGIYMFEPYQPGKIPVLMVHGLLSSPLTWTPMFNDLRADPKLRQHFQFWFYLYPTGDPYLATAANLRTALDRLRTELDPAHRDAALEQMVLVGHSMGGLVSKLVTQDSGDSFWHLVSAEPLDQVKLQAGARSELQRVFYFEKESCIRRVVFLGTPHHGSYLSPSPLGKLAAKLVRLPGDIRLAGRDLVQENPGLAGRGLSAHPLGRLPTSVDLLAPGAPALELLACRPPPPGIHYHSIIGIAFGKVPKGTDGVVPYRSAHLDTVDSEIVVPADHFHVHHHPQAVLEVQRILREHWRQVRTGANPAILPLSYRPEAAPSKAGR